MRQVAARFEFRCEWTTTAPVARVHDVLLDLERYPEWWPQVRAVARIDDDTARVVCRSVLPYSLDLVLSAESRDDRLLQTAITGDLEGMARFVLAPCDGGTRVSYEQEVVVAHRGLGAASRVLRPLLRWNHDHMMTGCRRGLQERAATAES